MELFRLVDQVVALEEMALTGRILPLLSKLQEE